MDDVVKVLTDRLKIAGYTPREIRVSRDVIQKNIPVPSSFPEGEASRINTLMDAGDDARK